MIDFEDPKSRFEKVSREIIEAGGKINYTISDDGTILDVELKFSDLTSDIDLERFTNLLTTALDCYDRSTGGSGLKVTEISGDPWIIDLTAPKADKN